MTLLAGDVEPIAVVTNVSVFGLTLIAAGVSPVPSSEEVSEPPCTFPLTFSEPGRSPVMLGLKLTWIVQVLPPASVGPQLLPGEV